MNVILMGSVQSSHSVMSDSLQPNRLQHTKLPCPLLSHGACSNACPLSQWCHPTISLFVAPFSFCTQSFLHQGLSSKSPLCIRWPKYWSFSFSISPPMNIQDSFTLGVTGLIFLLSKGLSRAFSSTTVQKHQFFGSQPSLWSNSHICTWLLEKP